MRFLIQLASLNFLLFDEVLRANSDAVAPRLDVIPNQYFLQLSVFQPRLSNRVRYEFLHALLAISIPLILGLLLLQIDVFLDSLGVDKAIDDRGLVLFVDAFLLIDVVAPHVLDSP